MVYSVNKRKDTIMIDETQLISMKTAADILGISVQRVCYMVRNGTFDVVYIDKHRFLNRQDVLTRKVIAPKPGRPRKENK